MMETKNIRISVHLNGYFEDHRRFSRVFVDDKILTINDLQNHITKVFNIPKCFYLLCNNHYLPPVEDIRVLNSDDIVHVVRSSEPIEDSINKSELVEINNLPCEKNSKVCKKKSKKVDLNIALINTSFIDEDCLNKSKKRERSVDDYDEYVCNKKSKVYEKTNLEILENEISDCNNCVGVKKKHKKSKEEDTENNKKKKNVETNCTSEINENDTITKKSKKNYSDKNDCTIDETENEEIIIKKYKKNRNACINNSDESACTKDEAVNENDIKIRKKTKKSKNNLDENECRKETENEIKLSKKLKKQRNEDMDNLIESESTKEITENGDNDGIKIRKKSKKMRNEETDTDQTNNSECATQKEEIKSTKSKKNKINELEETNGTISILEKDTPTNDLANPGDQTSLDNNSTVKNKSNNKIIVLNDEKVHKDMNAIRNILQNSHETYSLNQTLNFANKRLNSSRINSSSDNMNELDMFPFVTKRRRVRTRKRKCNDTSDDSFAVESPKYRPPNTAVTPLMHIKFNYNHSNSSNSSDVEQSGKSENIDQVAMTNLFQENEQPEGDENLKDLLLQKVKEKYVELFEKTDLNCIEILKEVPPEKSIITFKILKMAADYTPVISEHILAKVLGYDGNMVYLDILVGNNEFSDPKGKFSCDTEEEPEEVVGEPLFTNVFYEWNRMYEPRLITDK